MSDTATNNITTIETLRATALRSKGYTAAQIAEVTAAVESIVAELRTEQTRLNDSIDSLSEAITTLTNQMNNSSDELSSLTTQFNALHTDIYGIPSANTFSLNSNQQSTNGVIDHSSGTVGV